MHDPLGEGDQLSVGAVTNGRSAGGPHTDSQQAGQDEYGNFGSHDDAPEGTRTRRDYRKALATCLGMSRSRRTAGIN